MKRKKKVPTERNARLKRECRKNRGEVYGTRDCKNGVDKKFGGGGKKRSRGTLFNQKGSPEKKKVRGGGKPYYRGGKDRMGSLNSERSGLADTD